MTSQLPDFPTRLASRWTAMWNDELKASEVVAADCAVHFGRTPAIPRLTDTMSPQELQSVVDAVRAHRPGVSYGFVTAPLHQPEAGRAGEAGVITLLWHVDVPGHGRRSGIDLLRHRGGTIREVWSIAGDLELPPIGARALMADTEA